MTIRQQQAYFKIQNTKKSRKEKQQRENYVLFHTFGNYF